MGLRIKALRSWSLTEPQPADQPDPAEPAAQSPMKLMGECPAQDPGAACLGQERGVGVVQALVAP